jgi:hypothetical protein
VTETDLEYEFELCHLNDDDIKHSKKWLAREHHKACVICKTKFSADFIPSLVLCVSFPSVCDKEFQYGICKHCFETHDYEQLKDICKTFVKRRLATLHVPTLNLTPQ